MSDMTGDRVGFIYRTSREQAERLARYAAAHGGVSRNSLINMIVARELDRWEASQLVPQT